MFCKNDIFPVVWKVNFLLGTRNSVETFSASIGPFANCQVLARYQAKIINLFARSGVYAELCRDDLANIREIDAARLLAPQKALDSLFPKIPSKIRGKFK